MSEIAHGETVPPDASIVTYLGKRVEDTMCSHHPKGQLIGHGFTNGVEVWYIISEDQVLVHGHRNYLWKLL